MTQLTITEIGDPILRKKAKQIDNISHHQTLYDNMTETLRTVGGVGIAAPQVGESLQIFVIWIKPTRSYPHLEDTGPQIVINPNIITQSNNIVEDREGCLSVPGATPATGLKGKVPRPDRIQAERYDESGNHHSKKLEGFEARVFLHEYDHLQGIFFLGRMTSMETLCTSDRYQNFLTTG